MTKEIRNAAGERMTTYVSDAEAVRWWHEQGRRGDYLSDTGEELAAIALDIIPDVEWHFDRLGRVIASDQDWHQKESG